MDTGAIRRPRRTSQQPTGKPRAGREHRGRRMQPPEAGDAGNEEGHRTHGTFSPVFTVLLFVLLAKGKSPAQ